MQPTKSIPGVTPLPARRSLPRYPLTFSMRVRLARARAGNLWRRIKGYVEYKRGMPRFQAGFQSELGYTADFDNPTTFNEKVNWRKLHQNPPHFATITDKLTVRDYVDDVLGAPVSKTLFPEVLGAYIDPGAIPFDDLPANMILKCTHASQYNIFFRQERPVDRQLAVDELRLWLTQTWEPRLCEPAYWHLTPRIVAEPLLCHSHGPSADDIKIFVFDGVPRLVRYTMGRFAQRQDHWFTPEWDRPVGFAPLPKNRPEPPEHLAEMLDLAAHIAMSFDHLRVDFLTTDRDYWMNELTLYPSSGFKKFDPPQADLKMGEMWTVRKDLP